VGTFVVAYLTVLLAVVFYVVRLGGEQRRQQRVLEALQVDLDKRMAQ
jgi:hypothetical protein